MAEDVSIAFKASDNLTNSIRQMQKGVKGLSRDVSEYRKVQDQAFEKKTEIRFDITKAKQELKELEKAVKSNVDGSEQAFKDKQKSLEKLNEEYRRLTNVAKEASKAENKLQQDMHQTKNYTNSVGAEKGPSMMRSLAGAGLLNMAGGAVSNAANATLTSMYGENVGGAISGIIGTMATGTAMGSIAGPIGAAVGAAVGGLTGAINAMTAKEEKADDRFHDEVRSLYDLAKQEQQQSLSSGIGLSAKREKDMISYSTILGGDKNADMFLNDIQKFSAKTPFEMNDLLDTSKVMLSYGYKQDEILPMMTKIGDTGSALGIDAENQKVVATALGRMKSSGKTSLEYINQLTERAIPAIDYMAEALGKTNKQIYEMISKGTIDGAKASKIIIDAMGKEFEGNMEKQSATYDGLLSSLKDAQAQLDQAMGVGYTEKRKEGIQKELNALDGSMGQNMKDANKLIGEYQAELENKYQQSIISSMSLAQKTTEYSKAEAEGNGAEMGRILAEARVNAEIAYKNTEGYKMQQEADLGLVQSIQADVSINSAYMDYGKKMGEQFSIGYKGAVQSVVESGALGLEEETKLVKDKGSFVQKFNNGLKQEPMANLIDRWKNGPKGYATGLDRVPYNGMPAILHEGERVKTKVEADKEDRGISGGGINIVVNGLTVREEADIGKVASVLLAMLQEAAYNSA